MLVLIERVTSCFDSFGFKSVVLDLSRFSYRSDSLDSFDFWGPVDSCVFYIPSYSSVFDKALMLKKGVANFIFDYNVRFDERYTLVDVYNV